jgi:hypothetical protein
MSNKNQDLVLHLKLDTIIPDGSHRKVRNALSKSPLTESQYPVRGNPQVVPDEHFGSCFSFDGNDDVIELTPTSIPTGNEITVSFWANGGNNLPNKHSIIWAKTANNSRVLSIHLPWTDEMIYFDCGGNPKDQDSDYDRIYKSTHADNSQDAVTYKGKWNHWAFTKDAVKGEMKIYLNGVLWHHDKNKKQPILPAVQASIAKEYQGEVANFRIYKKALSPEEIKRDMDDDLSAIAAFNIAYPLDFDLYSGDDKESVIFSENDTKGEELVFEIRNNTEQAITLPAKSGGVSQDNYHFELRFRPDTLSPKSLQQLALASLENWSMSSPVTQTDGIVSLYFLTTKTTALEANGTITLTLQNISASTEGGARTTRVEFLCPAFTYQGETLTHYYREKTLSIISHRGKKNIPLHVSFVESNRILNDGKTQNELILRIVNVLKDKAIPLIPDSKGDEASKFIISFDVDFDWGLGTKSQVQGIEIQGKDWQLAKRYIEDWKIVKETEGESTTWTITNQNEENVELRPEQGIQLTISNIISSLPSGQTNLYIRYENIPGYWDGTFVCTIEKTPILYKEGNVGIGIADPGSYKLNVEGGDTRLGGSLYLGGDLKISGNETDVLVQNYPIELCSTPIGDSKGSYIKIADIHKEISIFRTNSFGFEAFIFSADGTYKKQQVFYQKMLGTEGDKGWNGLANWINKNSADGDLVAIISQLTYEGTKVVPIPSGEFAAQFFKSIGALKALKIVDHTPYVLLFVKGRYGVMECLAETSDTRTQIITNHDHLYPKLEVKGDLKVVNGAITINQTTITEKQLQDLIKLLNK